MRGIHRWPVYSPHKGAVAQKKFPFDDVIMRCCTGLDELYLAPPCTWTESNCYIYTRPSKSCRAPWCTFEHTLHCLYCPSRHLHQTPAHPGSISHTAVNFHPSSGSSDLWKKKWHQLLSPLGKSPVFLWSSAIDKQNLLAAHSKVDAVRWLNNLHFMIYGGDRQVDMPRLWYLMFNSLTPHICVSRLDQHCFR